MTVNVDLNIPVPLDTDNYNLVLDLNSMKAGILDSLNDIIVELGQRPETNTPASFFSVTCTSTGVFGTSVTVNSSDTGGPLVLNNSAASFGLEKASVASFKFTGGRWYSSAAIRILDGSASDDAASRGYVGTRETQLRSEIGVVQANVNALEAQTVVRYNGNQQWAPNANYANTAGYAASAGSAPLAAHNHDGVYAPAGNRPPTYYGITGDLSVPARGSSNTTITLPIVGTYPSFFGMTVVDVNGDEVFASVRSGWSTPNVVPVRLKNTDSGGETVRVSWVAMY
jgi:hypothetical protein